MESYKVDQDSITVKKIIGTAEQWKERKEIVLPTLSPSFCAILAEISSGKSLGVFKPTDIEFFFKKSIVQDEKKHQAAYNQLRFFDKKLKPIEQIPFTFYYKFRCHKCPDCPSHKLKIHDWELNESYRRWRGKYKGEELLEKIKQKWFNDICGSKKDVYFYVGNIWRHPKQFMVLGVFYPPKSAPILFTY